MKNILPFILLGIISACLTYLALLLKSKIDNTKRDNKYREKYELETYGKVFHGRERREIKKKERLAQEEYNRKHPPVTDLGTFIMAVQDGRLKGFAVKSGETTIADSTKD